MIGRRIASACALIWLLAGCGSDGTDRLVAEEPNCSAEEALCGTSCVDTRTDNRHCGGCNLACAAGQTCVDGSCVLTCPAGQTPCEGGCYDLQTSADHCGSCDNACADGEVCTGGTCDDFCPTGQTDCDGGCFDLQRSTQHCGGCGNACGAGEVCVVGSCAVSCPDGQDACDGSCHDLQTDRMHCGTCNNACGTGEVCAGGSCATTCPAGQEACDGGCFDLDTDVANCGACGAACDPGEICVDGGCATSCAEGLTDCDGTCRNLQEDRNACGSCGTVCASDETCIDGACILHCASGLVECDGACRDLDHDRAHCGACGNACTADEVCIDGQCTLTCAGFTDTECDGTCTNTDFDRNNCGTCGTVCAADEVCSNGACLAACDPSADVCAGGCTDLDTDPANCGTCGNVCPAGPNAVAVCFDGACTTVCHPGMADCDGDPANGCEANLATSNSHCGACGNSCTLPNAAGICVSGGCEITACNAGFVDCDQAPANGCETNTSIDPDNCGGCGVTCEAPGSCTGGQCVVPAGEDCSVPIDIAAGQNTIHWVASQNEYITAPVLQCAPDYADPVGGDIVLRYYSAYRGEVTLSFTKQSQNRWVVIVSTGPCGTLTPEIACISDWDPPILTGSFPVQADTTYWLYVTDTDSGTTPLLNPLQLTLTENLCDPLNPPPGPTITNVIPTAGSTSQTIRPGIQVQFSGPVSMLAGTVTVTGNLGTNHTIALPSPDAVLSADGMTLSILPDAAFPSGETLTVSLTGFEEQVCGSPVAPHSWSFSIPVVPCSPGQGGVVGTGMTRIPTGFGGSPPTEYYVVADADPDGWVYFGGTSALYRAHKGGAKPPENVYANAGLSASHLGYTMLVDGPNIYTVESKTSGTSGYLFRISSDGGATWTIEDMATFPSAPTDDFRAIAVRDGTIFLITAEDTSSVATQIWSVPAGVPGANATLLTTFGGYTYCSGLDVDDSYFYAACRIGTSSNYTVLRIARSDYTVAQIGPTFAGNTTKMELHADDTTGDGIADVIYFGEDGEEGYFLCAPHATPYFDLHHRFGTGTSNYGLGFDRQARVLWELDDDTLELIRID